MSTTGEATVNADGTTSFETPPVDDNVNATDDPMGEEEGFAGDAEQEEILQEAVKGTDPAIYLALLVLLIAAVWFYIWYSSKKSEEDDFFDELDGEKFNVKLPDAVDEYYKIKEKCLEAGWEPGKGPKGSTPAEIQANSQNGPHRIMAQALMKRCIADIPIVTHIQKESAGMNKLYSQSMCSVKQWRAYQTAEAMVSAEVDEVRAEADEIEPGWSQVIWRQAMQYHNMLKQKHEMEAKSAAESAKKQKEAENKVSAEQKKIDDAKAKELAAERAAQELIKAEEREKSSKKSFSGGGTMKKGFLDKGGKKK